MNLAGTGHNDSGSIALQVSWSPPAGDAAVPGYEVTRSTSAYTATSTVTATSYRDTGERSYCLPSVRYDVRTLTTGAGGQVAKSAPATTTVRSQTNCTRTC